MTDVAVIAGGLAGLSAALFAAKNGLETSVEGAYATGAMIRDQEWQAVISAGEGGAGHPLEGESRALPRFRHPRRRAVAARRESVAN